MVEGRLGAGFELGHDPVGKQLAQLHAPLVERGHVLDRADPRPFRVEIDVAK